MEAAAPIMFATRFDFLLLREDGEGSQGLPIMATDPGESP